MTIDQLRTYYGVACPPAQSTSRERGNYSIDDLPEGRLVERGSGTCFIAETVRPTTAVHGLHRFADMDSVRGPSLSAVMHDPRLTDVSVRDAVFLDTETTGLGVGAGTYIFLVGAGYFAGDNFAVKQFFLRGPHEEDGFLDVLGEFLNGFPTVVTFNGKAFDWPLLENRYIRNRREIPMADVAHLDLLHPARRLWKARLASCALKELETNILGVSRPSDDVPGWQIPELYFRYQRTGDGWGLRRVFEHNLYDILSLASLAIHMPLVVERPFDGLVNDARDFFSLGKVLEVHGDAARSVLCFEEVLRRTGDLALRRISLARLGHMHKRRRDWNAAMAAWTRLLDHGGETTLESLVEQAKYFEHVAHDPDRALDVVRHALDLAQLRSSGHDQSERAALEHRYRRLVARTSRLRVAG